MNPNVFTPVGSTVNLAAATTTARVARTSLDFKGGAQIRIANTGSVTVWVSFGDSTVTATLAASMPLLANTVEVFTVNAQQTHVAGITSTGSATIYITTGIGE